MRENFLQLVRLGVGAANKFLSSQIDWAAIHVLAEQQGIATIALDGIERLSLDQRPAKEFLLQWIGEVMQMESQYAVQQKVAAEMALLFHHNKIRTYVLKGIVVAECYPNPIHRNSVDIDCFLLPDSSDFDAWSLGNNLIRKKGFDVETGFYKNSTFMLPGLIVENHQYMVPFRGNRKLKNLEKFLQNMMIDYKGEDRINGTYLYRPPVMVTALFLIEHAFSHFLHEGLTWRMVLDWMMFSKKHKLDIDWYALDARIDEFGFRKFYDSYLKLGKFMIGEIAEGDLNIVDKKMLEDIWAPLDIHETVRGVKGKFALAGNTWRARWKYQYFTDMNWQKALWIQIKGFMFEKSPTLN